jgi:hypothetical protein
MNNVEQYPYEVEEAMRRYFSGLNEKDRRLYAGVEAIKIGRGGRSYIAKILGCSRNTVTKGVRELTGLTGCEAHDILRDPDPNPMSRSRIRKTGGGRPTYEQTWGPALDAAFLDALREHTAGDPMDEKVRWTNLSLKRIKAALERDHNIEISTFVVRNLLKKHNYRRRKIQKRTTMKSEIKDRNEQFVNIAQIRDKYAASSQPIISMDTKKKEMLGNFYRDGKLYTIEELKAYDHDFKSFAEGDIIPHCFYDLRLNIGYIQLGTSHDTGEFACDSFRHWWYHYGRIHYPEATSILVLCDGGGSNSSHQFLFKQDLQQLANEIGVEIRIAHYPPYCSKYNPIEHRLFPHITRACQGVIFSSIDLVKELMSKTNTSTGLTAFVHVIDKVYETGRKVAANFKKSMKIIFDGVLPKWNYRTVPENLSKCTS